jgi:hypothetical protein
VTIGVQRIEIEPGAFSTPVHTHAQEEEIFYVLRGSGLSLQDGKAYEIRAGDFLVHTVLREAHTLRADEDGLDVDLGPGARLHVRFTARRGWPRRALGGIGLGHLVPGLGQYWHPHMLDAEATGTAVLGERRLDLRGARAYAEKNWTPYAQGFPRVWWWGQAHGFADDDVCVAFAGGRLRGFPAGALVLRVGAELIHATGPPVPLRMRLGDGTWRLQARTSRHAVTIEGEARAAPYRLPVPKPRERRAAAPA